MRMIPDKDRTNTQHQKQFISVDHKSNSGLDCMPLDTHDL